MRNRSRTAITHAYIDIACEYWCDEPLDIRSFVLVVGVGVDDDVGAEPQRGIETSHVGDRQTPSARKSNDVMNTKSGCNFARPIVAAVIDDQDLDDIDTWNGTGQFCERLRQLIAFVETRDLYDETDTTRTVDGSQGLRARNRFDHR